MLSYQDIVTEIETRVLRRAYLLFGEDTYYIDRLCNLFTERVIPKEEQDFNLTVLYGSEKGTDASSIARDAMRFPMMGERHLVIIKEAQLVSDIERLGELLDELPETTCLVVAYKKKADKRKGLYKGFLAQEGSIFESMPLSEREVPHFISQSLAVHNIKVDAHTAVLMSELTGNDREKIAHNVDKLSIFFGLEGGTLTPELMEEQIGVSREYNNFELLSALIHRDVSKAFRIAYHFASNEKTYPIQMTLPILFNYFSQLMGAYYLPQKDERSLAQGLGISPYIARDYAIGLQSYSARQVFGIIHQIRLSDAYSKGVGASLSGGEILKELVSYILTT